MTISIFYDLETSHLKTVGQILNYAFYEVDAKWDIKSTCVGKIKISNIELPDPGSIAVNRINVHEHQAEAETEQNAMVKIRSYLEKVIHTGKKGKRYLVGYNSNRFDIHFLRTSMIRNGLNPYFGNTLVCRDLLHVCQKLAVSNEEFMKELKAGTNGAPSLRLRHTGKIWGDTAEQSHESHSDVETTIKVAKSLYEKYGIHVALYEPYEAEVHEIPGKVIMKVFPDWESKHHLENENEAMGQAPMTLLWKDKKSALWINLERYQKGEGKNSIFWYNRKTSSFYVDSVFEPSDELSALVQKAREEFKDIRVDNFFPPKVCDVEADIYMLTFEEVDALTEAIWEKKTQWLKRLKSKPAAELFMRHLIRGYKIADGVSHNYLADYVRKRYTGKMNVGKGKEPEFSRHIKTMLAEIETLKQNESDREIMLALEDFYRKSKPYEILSAESEV